MMSDDLVKRLRGIDKTDIYLYETMNDAADCIEELEDKVAAYKDQNNRLFRGLREAWPDDMRRSDEPFTIAIQHVTEHENGDATYTFDMSDKARDAILEDGLKLMLYCGICKVDLQDVYDWILTQGKEKEDALHNDTP